MEGGGFLVNGDSEAGAYCCSVGRPSGRLSRVAGKSSTFISYEAPAATEGRSLTQMYMA